MPMSRRLAIAMVATCCAAPLAAQSSISGTYRAEGRNPDGSAYFGTVQLTESGGAVSMTWQVGNQSYVGTGLREGRVISVNWGDAHPVVYVIMPNGALHGTWADGRASERLTR